MALVIPGGTKKGTPLDAADTKDLEYWAKRLSDELDKDPQKKWANKDREWIAAARAEMDGRRNGTRKQQAAPPKPEAAAQSKAIERAQSGGLAAPAAGSGTISLEQAIHNPAVVTAKLRELSSSFHLVTPVTSVDALPPGCGISISYVQVDPNPDAKEVYKVGDRMGLSMDTLKRIGAAAGIDWDPRQSGRLDDGSDPHYCHYRAVGTVRSFDGTLRTLTGEVEMDLREGSPQVDEIRSKAAGRAAEGKKSDGGASQLLEQRKFILRHAESKAKNRAIADMGVKRSYAPAELGKPFAVARIVWTGQTDDPELKKTFAIMHAERMMDGAAALYGRTPPTLPQARQAVQSLPAPAPVHEASFRGHTPPPLGAGSQADTDDWGGYDYDAEGDEQPGSGSQPQAGVTSTQPAAASEGQQALKV